MVLSRRMFLALFAGAILSAPARRVLAKDGRGGDDGGDDGGHGGDDGGDNSGPGHDDDGGKDGGQRDDKGARNKSHEDEWSQDKVLKERELGRVISLRKALDIVEARVQGRIIDINLLARGDRPQYRVKVRRADGVIQTVRLDARTGRVIGLLGF
ncbi:PepSY domain-containing protein [Rhizobium sp.]